MSKSVWLDSQAANPPGLRRLRFSSFRFNCQRAKRQPQWPFEPPEPILGRHRSFQCGPSRSIAAGFARRLSTASMSRLNTIAPGLSTHRRKFLGQSWNLELSWLIRKDSFSHLRRREGVDECAFDLLRAPLSSIWSTCRTPGRVGRHLRGPQTIPGHKVAPRVGFWCAAS